MQKINVEFIIKLDKEVYLDSPWKTREEFFNKNTVKLHLKYLNKDLIMMERYY